MFIYNEKINKTIQWTYWNLCIYWCFSGAGIFDSIIKGITSKFVKDRAKTLGTKPLEAGVNKVGAEIGTRAANKVISVVDKKFSKRPKEVKTIIYKKSWIWWRRII